MAGVLGAAAPGAGSEDAPMGVPNERRQRRKRESDATTSKQAEVLQAAATMKTAFESDASCPPCMRAMGAFMATQGGHFSEQMTEVREDIEDLHTRADKQDGHIAELQRELKALKTGSLVSTGAASTRGGTSVHGVGSRPRWDPAWIEFKGWLKDEDWKNSIRKAEKMISDEDVVHLITNFKEALDETDRTKIDDLGTLRMNGNRPRYGKFFIKFVAGTESDFVWTCKRFWDDILTPMGSRTAEQRARNRPAPDVIFANVSHTPRPDPIKLRVEAPPWKADHISAIGRFHGIWETCILRKCPGTSLRIKGVTGSGKGQSVIWTQPPNLTTNRAMELAHWTAARGTWMIDKEVWNTIVMPQYGITVSLELFEAELAAC